jgi:YgiT-type zinc finger domain-containing protein
MNSKSHPCEYCDTSIPLEYKLVTVTRQRGGKWFIFEDTPAWVCPNCGHRYFDADVLERMEAHMTDTPDEARRVEAWAMSLSDT